MSSPDTTRALLREANVWLVVLASLLATIAYVDVRSEDRRYAEDFVPVFWRPWEALRSGVSPYPDPSDPLANGSPFLYPPLAAELTLPMSWLPFDTAFVVFAVGVAVAAALLLWALDVRDRGLWLIWMLSPIVVGSVAAGQPTLFVALGVALAWRWRDRPVWGAAALTAAVVIKPFVWPMLLWLVVTRRYRTAVLSIGATAFLALASWAVIGFDGMADYPALLDATTKELGPNGLLVYALLVQVAGHIASVAVSLAFAAALLLAAYVRRFDDRASLTLVLLAALYATPIFWGHYFSLLLLPATFYGGWVWATIPLTILTLFAPVGVPRPAWLIAVFVAMTAAVAYRALENDVSARDPAPRLSVHEEPA